MAQRASRRRWKRPARFDRDLIVIGAGAAGLVAANIASTLRARVTLVEREAMGGDCLNTGCVPSKALIRIAERVQLSRDLARRGLYSDGGGEQSRLPDFRLTMDQVRDTVDQIAPHDSVSRYESLGVECLRGEAQALSPWTVAVRTGEGSEPRVLRARHLIIATGAEPIVPDIAGLPRQQILTTQTLWSIDALPARLLILGGGAVGCEMAQAFRRLGSVVCVVERADRLLPREEPEASAEVLKAFTEDGIAVLLGSEVLQVKLVDQTQVACVNVNGRQEQVAFDRVLCALGRRARVEGAGLESLGLARLSDGTLQVDDWMRTSEPSIFACGDVATTDRLTHVAGQMGWHAAVNALFGDIWPIKIDRTALPRCTFTDPAVARVGPTRDEAERAGYRVDCTRLPLNTVDRAIIDRQTRG
ncbi:MAG: FAD-binding protein, partial [Actinobacteria bacterium]|nr:FAD-binding protein [Actinomycetota bacterium]